MNKKNDYPPTLIPSRARLVTHPHRDVIEITYHKITPKQSQIIASLSRTQEQLLQVALQKIHSLKSYDLQNWYNARKKGWEAFKLSVETYESFKKRKLREANEQI